MAQIIGGEGAWGRLTPAARLTLLRVARVDWSDSPRGAPKGRLAPREQAVWLMPVPAVNRYGDIDRISSGRTYRRTEPQPRILPVVLGSAITVRFNRRRRQ